MSRIRGVQSWINAVILAAYIICIAVIGIPAAVAGAIFVAAVGVIGVVVIIACSVMCLPLFVISYGIDMMIGKSSVEKSLHDDVG